MIVVCLFEWLIDCFICFCLTFSLDCPPTCNLHTNHDARLHPISSTDSVLFFLFLFIHLFLSWVSHVCILIFYCSATVFAKQIG